VQQHPGVILRQQGHVESTAARGDMIEADLVAEDGFSRTGRTLNDKDAAPQKAAPQNRIQPWNSGRDVFECRRGYSVSRHLLRQQAEAAM
jgi:hypothetical protein